MTKKLQILKVISEIRDSHSEMVNIFSYGSCMNFFCILKTIYPEAKCYYDINHVITKIDNNYYDITGLVEKKSHIPFTQIYNKRRTSRAFTQMYNSELKLNNNDKRNKRSNISTTKAHGR